MIRRWAPTTVTALREIERLAGARFREVGLDGIADAEPASVDTLTAYARRRGGVRSPSRRVIAPWAM